MWHNSVYKCCTVSHCTYSPFATVWLIEYGFTELFLWHLRWQCKRLFPHANKAHFDWIEMTTQMTTQNRGTSVFAHQLLVGKYGSGNGSSIDSHVMEGCYCCHSTWNMAAPMVASCATEQLPFHWITRGRESGIHIIIDPWRRPRMTWRQGHWAMGRERGWRQSGDNQ